MARPVVPAQAARSAKALAWRGLVAGCASATFASGVYPLLAFAGARLARKRRALTHPPLSALPPEYLLGLHSALVRPLGFLPMPGAGVSGARPLVMVHGFAMSRGYMRLLARRLARAGHGPIFGYEYWSLGKVSGAARGLAKFIDQVRQGTGADKVDVIGHSMGGVVGRYCALFGDGRDSIANLVTLGSPHNGIEVSVFGVGRPTKELAPNSPTLSRLSAAPAPTARVYTVWSRADVLVGTEAEARIPCDDELILPDLGHMGLLASRRVASAITDFLASPAANRVGVVGRPCFSRRT